MFKIFKLVIIIITFILIKTETSYASNSLIDVDKLELKISDDLGDGEILERTYLKSFNKLIAKIVLSKDYPLAQSEATQDVIKDMVFSYKLKDSRSNDNINDQRDYVEVNYKYDKLKVYNFLRKLNISFSSASEIEVSIFPVLVINNNLNIFNNFFYKNWLDQNENQSELVTYLLPAEDLDIIDFFKKNSDSYNQINLNDPILNRESKNIVLIFFEEKNDVLSIYLKSKILNDNKVQNLRFNLSSSKKSLDYNFIINVLKKNISDTWKLKNLVDLNIPLNLKLNLEIDNLSESAEVFDKIKLIEIIEDYKINLITKDKIILELKYYGNLKTLQEKLNEKQIEMFEKKFEWFIRKI